MVEYNDMAIAGYKTQVYALGAKLLFQMDNIGIRIYVGAHTSFHLQNFNKV